MISEKVMEFFGQISALPRPSGHCEKIADYLESFADARSLWHKRDEWNNVIIKKPAAVGREGDSTVMIQGHTDIVGEKTADSTHDFVNDPIKLIYDGDTVHANGTTLGGDDGFAVALMLALLDDSELDAPAIECVFTTDEEIGMIGAVNLDTSDLNAKYLINADSEDEGVFTCGCCGGICIDFDIPVKTEPATDASYTKVTLCGLKGGHSGTEINSGRLNAVKLMAELLEPNNGIVLIERDGKDNAIPERCDAIITAGKEAVLSRFWQLREEWAKTEPGVTLEIEPCSSDLPTMSSDSAERVLTFLKKLPFGVQKMCDEPEGLVHTSDNIGIINTLDESVTGTVSVRSVSEKDRDALCNDISKLCEGSGGSIRLHGAYPGWEYKNDSVLRDVMCRVWEDMFDSAPTVDVIHAGLECGVILSKMPWLDIVSIGPELHDIHTPKERMSISSVKRCTDFVCQVLKEIK